MIDSATSTGFQPRPIVTLPAAPDSFSQPILKEELLPFTVRLVRNDDDLNKAVQIRHSAYARHLPEFAETLKKPECEDAEDGVVILLAESKLDGSPLGTMRIQTNQFKPLSLEESIQLPAWLKTKRLAEATRLGVTNEKGGRLVTTVMFKAYFQYCQENGIDWMVVTGRAPVDRTYDRLLFDDVFPGVGYIPIHHVGDIPHRVMKFDVAGAEDLWRAAKHPLFDFIVRTHHKDINVGGRAQFQGKRPPIDSFAAHGRLNPM